MDREKTGVPKSLVALAVAVGVAAGSYGIASAASGSGSGSSSSSSSTPAPPALSGSAAAGAPAPSGRPWGMQRSDEMPLSGDALAKVTAIAKAKVPGGTIVRVETDADGNAAYEAHMTKSDGTPVTVYVNKDFEFVSVETR